MLRKMKFAATIVAAVVSVFIANAALADLILGAPPRETSAAGDKVYGALADFLSKATGEKVVYEHPGNWGLYQALMTLGHYDLVFDGPHFVDWRDNRLKHVPLVALNGTLGFVVIARANDPSVHTLDDLAGRGVCAHDPPNLATLTLLDRFSNPARQPRLVEIKGFKAAFDGLMKKNCAGTVIPIRLYSKLDGQHQRTRVLFQSAAMPNQALTAGPKVSAAARARIIEAMTSPRYQDEVSAIARSLGGKSFVPTSAAQYQGYMSLLRNVWGFGMASQ